MSRTPKAKALGAALRQAREEKHMLLREVGAAIDRDIGMISRWETGDRAPKPEQVAQILATLGIQGERYQEIMTLAYGTNESQWVATTLPEQRQQMVAYLDWEQNARRIVEVAPLLVPGILQTSDYIRAIMTDPGSGVPAGEVASRITTRLGRREVITKHNPANLLVLLGQAALTQGIGGRQTMIGQLRYLLEMDSRPNIELRIVPDNRGWHPGLEGDFTLIESPRIAPGNGSRRSTSLESIVFVGNRRTVLMLHEDDDVATYTRAIDRIMDRSLPPEQSVTHISELVHRMEKNRVK